MRALVVKQAGPEGPANVSYSTDWPDLTPSDLKPGEALVRTLASALNHLDLWVCRGVPGLKLDYPRVSGSDACGIVEAVGEGVDQAWVGRRVILNASLSMPQNAHPDDPPTSTLAPEYELLGEHRNGTHREKFVAPAANLALAPDNLDPADCAAFGLTFLTAYSMLKGKACLRPGQTVLITGIGGGVALAAMAIARHIGCPVVVTSRHQWKVDKARELGAAHGIVDVGQDWSRDVREWSRKRGVDVAVDSAGKATHLRCIKSLARGGAYVTPGCTSGPDAVTDLARVFWNQLRIMGSTMGTPAEFSEIAALLRNGSYRPTVDHVFNAEQGQEAFKKLDAGEQFGKIVVRWE